MSVRGIAVMLSEPAKPAGVCPGDPGHPAGGGAGPHRGGGWERRLYESLDATLTLSSIGLDLPLSEIYA